MNNNEFIFLCDLWCEHRYLEVGNIINREKWKPKKVAEFCAYLSRYLGVNELYIFYKFL